MCISLPGRVKRIDGMEVTVEYPSETRRILDGGVSVDVGDYVLVQMGVIIKKLSAEEAKTAKSAWE